MEQIKVGDFVTIIDSSHRWRGKCLQVDGISFNYKKGIATYRFSRGDKGVSFATRDQVKPRVSEIKDKVYRIVVSGQVIGSYYETLVGAEAGISRIAKEYSSGTVIEVVEVIKKFKIEAALKEVK